MSIFPVVSSSGSEVGSAAATLTQPAITQASVADTAAAPGSAVLAPAAKTSSATAASIASGVVLSQLQLGLVSSLFGNGSSDSISSSPDGLLGILNQAYGASADVPTNGSATPYDTLVAAIQNSLDKGSGTAATVLSYLNPKGNFLDVSARGVSRRPIPSAGYERLFDPTS